MAATVRSAKLSTLLASLPLDGRGQYLALRLLVATPKAGVLANHPVGQEWLAGLFGLSPKNFRAKPLLEAVRDALVATGCAVEIGDHEASHTRYRKNRFCGQARTVTVCWTGEWLEALAEERAAPEAGPRFDLKGRQLTPRVAAERRRRQYLDRAAKILERVRADGWLSESHKRFYETYLGRSTGRLGKLAGVVRAVKPEALDPRNRAEELEKLRKIADAPWQLVRPSAKRKTFRPAPVGDANVLSLRRSTRQALGLVEVDLKSAYLSIAAVRFGCGRLQALLASGADVPAKIAGELGVDRKLVKDAINALLFGEARRARHARLGAAAAAFDAHPLVQELLAGRNAFLRRARREGGIRLCSDGRFVSLDEFSGKLHALPTLVFSDGELFLMTSLYEIEGRDFTVAAHLNDGAALLIHHRDEKRRGQVLRRLQRAVEQRAASIGLSTRLEVVSSEVKAPAKEVGKAEQPGAGLVAAIRAAGQKVRDFVLPPVAVGHKLCDAAEHQEREQRAAHEFAVLSFVPAEAAPVKATVPDELRFGGVWRWRDGRWALVLPKKRRGDRPYFAGRRSRRAAAPTAAKLEALLAQARSQEKAKPAAPPPPPPPPAPAPSVAVLSPEEQQRCAQAFLGRLRFGRVSSQAERVLDYVRRHVAA